MESRKRESWIDRLNVIAVFGVILIHTSGSLLYSFNKEPIFDWWIGNLFDSMARFSVPVFGMIMGATILRNEYSIGTYFKKRGLRLIPPFLFWALVYLSYDASAKFYHGWNPSYVELFFWVGSQVTKGIAIHFWYVYLIVGIYFLLPWLKWGLRKLTDSSLSFVLVSWFSLLLVQFLFLNIDHHPNYFTYLICFLGYPVLGYYFSIKTLKSNRFAMVLLFVGAGITVFGTYYSSLFAGVFKEEYYSFISPNVALLACGVFLLVKNSRIENRLFTRIQNTISKHRYGIYLVHILVLWLLGLVGVSSRLITPLLGVPLTATLGLIISLGIVLVLNKVPFGKFFAG